MDEHARRRLSVLLVAQDGVVGRAQLHDLGLGDHDIRRMRRRRELVTVHDGVYVDHTGRLRWIERAWAAVLSCWPAALCGDSARRAADLGRRAQADDHRPIHVAIAHRRTVRPPEGVAVVRKVDFAEQVRWSTMPPVQRAEHWALDVAAAAERDLDAVAVIAEAVGQRRVTPAALSTALAGRARIARRRFLTSVVEDVASGTCSTLEHGYLVRVERPHGLPTARRQFRESAKGTLYRDAVYAELGAIVELDGRLHHTRLPDRDRDLERDLDAAVTDRVTARLGWGQVFDRPCPTAFKIGLVLANRGWAGAVRRCPACPVGLAWEAASTGGSSVTW